MSRSKHWKSEWEMFIGSDGRRKYNPLCKDKVQYLSQKEKGQKYRHVPALLVE